ncbi:MAG: hypothetical protein ACREFD_14675 [Stellaceae bacterium]
MTREPIYGALFALIQSAAGFATASRRLRHWSDVAAIEQPALFMVQKSETAEQQRGLPAKWSCDVDLYLYCHAPDETSAPTTILNPLLDAVEAALMPLSGEDLAINTRTLGGLAYRAFINGKIETDEGTLGGQSVAIVPVRILIP